MITSLNHSISHALGSKCPIPRKPNETIAEALVSDLAARTETHALALTDARDRHGSPPQADSALHAVAQASRLADLIKQQMENVRAYLR